MSNTPIQVTTDLGQILERIDSKIDTLQKDVTDIKLGLVKLEGEVKGDIKALDAKVDGIAKRLDNQEFINRSVVVGLLLAILAGLAKMFFPKLG